MPAKTLVIGLDSINATLLERWADRGCLPNVAALRARASVFRLDAACMDTLPGAIWSDIIYGQDSARHGLYFHPEQLDVQTGLTRRVPQDQLLADRTVWRTASTAGRRCAVVDVPFMPLVPDDNCVQVREYAVHDISYGFGTAPPELGAELVARHGEPPLHSKSCDTEYERKGTEFICRALLERAQRKTSLLSDLMGRETWDLFFAVYGESHCGSHYLWPRQASGDMLHTEAESAMDVWEPTRMLYQRIDAGIGRLVAEAGPEAGVILFISHGVGPYFGGPQLLPEFLRRLELSDGREWPGRWRLRQLADSVRRKIPVRLVSDLPLASGRAIASVRRFLGAELHRGANARSKAFAMPNNRIGAIRLNIAGRDPHGCLSCEEARALAETLIHELKRLKAPDGTPIVHSIQRTAEVFGNDAAAWLPDLLVKFRTDLGPIERCHSPAVGHIHAPNARPYYRRAGDHVPQSRAWISAPEYPPGRQSRGDVLDLAPTILDLAGVARPAHMTGVPLRARLADRQ